MTFDSLFFFVLEHERRARERKRLAVLTRGSARDCSMHRIIQLKITSCRGASRKHTPLFSEYPQFSTETPRPAQTEAKSDVRMTQTVSPPPTPPSLDQYSKSVTASFRGVGGRAQVLLEGPAVVSFHGFHFLYVLL